MTTSQLQAHPRGTHRVVGQTGVLPQAARRLDPRLPIRDNEILITVEALNVDAASFRQIEEAAEHDPARIAAHILAIVAERGKLQNPVTGSGGVLIGRVAAIGARHPGSRVVAVGESVVTLVSLSLTPLALTAIRAVDHARHQVAADGHAILFERTIFAPLPPDFPDHLAMAIYDVCGAPAQTARLVQPGQAVMILGAGGKSGLLCAAEALRRLGPSGRVIAVEPGLAGRERLRCMDDPRLTVLAADATDPLAVREALLGATGGPEVDLAINCVNVPGTEMATILPVRDGGTAYFFSMATSFTAATLGAEGAVKDVRLMMGNGYAPGHARHALDLVRATPILREIYESW
ncbi:MAG TPA: L-erythro-3,5-diaminohexanoate dehydrogenase [Ardenticatenaceae bacterium]|nr:L-erythro-3,5-diaminohexanoate dehydrogenase [Ardenticatenaceae bacterium]